MPPSPLLPSLRCSHLPGKATRAIRISRRRDAQASSSACKKYYSSSSTSVSTKPPKYGQPLPSTHPHLFSLPSTSLPSPIPRLSTSTSTPTPRNQGLTPTSERDRDRDEGGEEHLTPGIPKSEYESRRRNLIQRLEEENGGQGVVVVCMGGTVRFVSQQIFYKFRQSTDFHYLSGFDEPDSTLILESSPSSPRGYKYTLFVPPKDPHEALWAGECSGVEGAVSLFGADEAFPNTGLSTYLLPLLRHSNLYASLPPSPSPSLSSQPFHPPPPRRRSSLLKLFSHSHADFSPSGSDPPHLVLAAALAGDRARPLEREVQRLRMRKSENELRLMKIAADWSASAHRRVMRSAEPGKTEAMLAAEFEYQCALSGSERPAYVPVVASGANGLIIHYTNNDCVLGSDDLVLIDAGCEYSLYASDITRTFPVSGRFTPPQKDLYEAVLNVQKECVKRCRVEDGVSLNELHRASCVLLTEELRQIGFKLSTGEVERRLYPHFLSHHLGSDLHDCPSADRSAPLVEGNVVTIEPGIYVPPESSFPKAFHNLAIRIEDEVAFIKDGPWVLSSNAPKEVVDVEAVCQGLVRT